MTQNKHTRRLKEKGNRSRVKVKEMIAGRWMTIAAIIINWPNRSAPTRMTLSSALGKYWPVEKRMTVKQVQEYRWKEGAE